MRAFGKSTNDVPISMLFDVIKRTKETERKRRNEKNIPEDLMQRQRQRQSSKRTICCQFKREKKNTI